MLRVLLLGDIVGAPGRAVFQKHIQQIKRDYSINAVIVNGENSAHGRGITSRIMRFFKHNGVDVVTSGNHIFRNKEIYSYLTTNKDLLRPLNFPAAAPGPGVTTFLCEGYTIGVINVQGQVFMPQHLDSPFRAVETALTYLRNKTNIIFVDMHAETTAEKMGLAYLLDGQVTAVVGTHTHVQTADNRILPQGTAYITDLGMAGALNSMIGMKKEPILQHMLTQMPVKFEVENKGPLVLSGAWVEVDVTTGHAVTIERVYIIDDTITVGESDEYEK